MRATKSPVDTRMYNNPDRFLLADASAKKVAERPGSPVKNWRKGTKKFKAFH